MVTEFAPAEVKNLLESDPEHILLDVREPWEYDYVRLPQSRNIPLPMLPDCAHLLDTHAKYVVCCHHGVRSMQAALYLKNLGFQYIVNLEGGIHAWAEDVDQSLLTY